MIVYAAWEVEGEGDGTAGLSAGAGSATACAPERGTVCDQLAAKKLLGNVWGRARRTVANSGEPEANPSAGAGAAAARAPHQACGVCGKSRRDGDQLFKCAGCRAKWYCGVEHQTQDWKAHSKECMPAV